VEITVKGVVSLKAILRRATDAQYTADMLEEAVRVVWSKEAKNLWGRVKSPIGSSSPFDSYNSATERNMFNER
jgi:hypothetical protein